MRWITPSLVVLSLVFSTGGVAIVGRADSSATSTPAALPVKPAATQCAVPNSVPRNAEATRRRRTATIDQTGKNTVVLNTSGYNYPTDGQWKPSPVDAPKGMTPAPK